MHSEQTQENLERFEHQAGLTETVYSPHKGLSAEEPRIHRLADGKLPVSTNKRSLIQNTNETTCINKD